ncbi:MAG: Ca2+-dependent phosphoinositide-specific phospholipase C [Verrucomicrobiota bacterium]
MIGRTFQLLFPLALLFLPGLTSHAESPTATVRLNEIQVIGTHNSYHLEPSKPVMDLIEGVSADVAKSIAYAHKPLEDQLGPLGIRQLEWDLYADPEGGLFAEPAARKMIANGGGNPGPSHDPEGVLKKPGLKILHSPDFDFLTTSLTFKHALASLRQWSRAHPDHVPILVLIELKESSASPFGVKPVAFDRAQLDGVDAEILSVFERSEILTPDAVRGNAETLREVIVGQGWPLLDSVRGKVMFALDNGGSLRDRYVDGHPSLRDRLLFATVDEADPAAAWFKINDPIREFDRIQRLVKAGFLVRTRADSNTRQARENDPEQRNRAFASGAQFVSTDYPEPNPGFSAYHVRFDGGMVARTNPVSGRADLRGTDMEAPTSWIECEGAYGGHLQGVATDGEFFYWSHTVALVKTDLKGKVLKQIEVPNHHGDLTLRDGEVFVAVEFGPFNRPAGQSDPWVYVYSADTLAFLRKHRVPELVHGSGGIAYGDGRFVVVGGLPGDYQQNYAFEYNEAFEFVKRHVLPSGQTKLGIQTAGYVDGRWWFGCYGSPGNPGLLVADKTFRLVGQAPTDFSFGVERFHDNTLLRGECFAENKRGKVALLRGPGPELEAVPVQVRFAAYNVLFGIWAAPEHVAAMFKPYDLDIIGFNEVPGGDWTERVGGFLGMNHAYVGRISSANHKDKFKSILSRTPLTNQHEIEMVDHAGWSPASLVGAETTVRGTSLLVYSTHIPGRPSVEGSAAEFIAESVIPQANSKGANLVLLGDLNNRPGEATLKRIEASGMQSMWESLNIRTEALSTHRHMESGKESGVIDHLYFAEASKARAIEGGVIYNAFNSPGADKAMSIHKEAWKQYGKPLSDHRPVWAVIQFPPPNQESERGSGPAER